MKNLKLILCILIIMIASKSQGQSKLSFGLNSSYLVNNRVFTYHKSDTYIDYRNLKERYKSGFDISAAIRYKIKDKLSFETGIGYSDIGYQTKEEKLIDPGFSPLTAGYYSILYVFGYQNIYLPIHLEYSTVGKFNFIISFGPSLVFPISEKVNVILRREFGNLNGQNVSNYPFGNKNEIKKINTSLDLGFGMGYRLTNKINIALQPKISYFLFSNENVWAKGYLYYLSMFYGQNSTTKENLYSVGLSLKISVTP